MDTLVDLDTQVDHMSFKFASYITSIASNQKLTVSLRSNDIVSFLVLRLCTFVVMKL